MDSASLLTQFRADVVDTAAPTLWSDAEIFYYMDEAQKKFCRLVNGLNDAVTTAVTQLPVTLATDIANTSPLILKFRHAYRTSDGLPIDIVNYEDLVKTGFRLDGRPGPVKMLILGMTENVAKFYPFPNQVDTIQLLVERLPLVQITTTGQALEIGVQHHASLLLWMKHMAYAKQDAETRDDKKSAGYEADFEAYCALARKEKERAMHKTRVVAYGGIGSTIGVGGPAYDSRGRSNAIY